MGNVLVGCLIGASIPAFLALVMFLMAYLVRATGRKRATGCTVPVTATIIDLRQEKDTGNYTRISSYKYVPTYSYVLDGETRTVEDIIGFSEEESKQYQPGTQVELMVNPDDPYYFELPGQTENRMDIWMKVGYFFVGLTVVTFVLLLIFCLI